MADCGIAHRGSSEQTGVPMKRHMVSVVLAGVTIIIATAQSMAQAHTRITCNLLDEGANISLSIAGSVRNEITKPATVPPSTQSIRVCKKLAAEAVAYDPFSRRLFVADQADLSLDIYNIMDIFNEPQAAHPFKKIYTDQLFGPGEGSSWTPDHVDVRWGLVAFAVSSDPVTDPGRVALLDSDGRLLRTYTVGPRPDMLAYTPNGRYIVVANEGRPNDTYTQDPEGSVSIIDPWSIAPRTSASVRTADFGRFNERKEQLIAEGVRIYGPCTPSPGQPCDHDGSATVAQDLEPVFLAISRDSSTAWVNLESNNAIAKVDLNRATVLDVLPLGLKDHKLPGNELDATRDEAFDLRNWPVLGMYMASAGATFSRRGEEYLLTVNRGNWREVGTYDEKTDVRAACANGQLDPVTCGQINAPDTISTLKIAKYPHRFDPTEFPKLDAPYSYGGRSFSILSDRGQRIYDSSSQLEALTYRACPAFFNSQSDQNTFDDRSGQKGPEPQGVAVGRVGQREYAFIALKRIGGIMVYDVTDPRNPIFEQYINNRDFAVEPKTSLAVLPPPYNDTELYVNCDAGDIQPEDVVFVDAQRSPIHEPLLLVTSDYSGSMTIFRIATIRR